MGESIDPIAYDVRELRELARVRGDRYVAEGFLWTELPEPFPPAEETAEYDRPATWTGSLEERQKPYLRDLPDGADGRRVAREWVEGLVERAGSDAAVEALAYYESLGWLTEAVREELEGYLLAVGYRAGGSLEDLTRADHVESLARTARLAGLADPDGDASTGSTDEGNGDRAAATGADGASGTVGNDPPEAGTRKGGSTADAGDGAADAVGDESAADAGAWWGTAAEADGSGGSDDVAGSAVDDPVEGADDAPGEDPDDGEAAASTDGAEDDPAAGSGFEFGTRTE